MKLCWGKCPNTTSLIYPMPKESNHLRTYRGLTERIKTLLDRQGMPSQSSRHTPYLIYDTLLDMRTSYIKRNRIARQGIGQQNIQTIPCVKLIEADTNICPCRPPTGCTWLRSKNPIPKIISLTAVTNSNANFKADYVEWSQAKNKLYSRSRREGTRYFTHLDTGDGPYLYLYNDFLLENVSLTGLWEVPNHAAHYTSCKKETKHQEKLRCNPLDTPLYCDADMVDVIFKMTFDFLSRSNQVSTPDLKNDSLDDITGQNNTV